MDRVQAVDVPPEALLQRYRDGANYLDAFRVFVPRTVPHARFVEAFYTTWLFRLERGLLAWAVRRPSTDAEAAQVARGERDAFAAWLVQARAPDQLLLRDYRGQTCSWFMTQASGDGTWLWFGSAVVAAHDAQGGGRRLGPVFRALLGFHVRYSRALLQAARRRLLAAA